MHKSSPPELPLIDSASGGCCGGGSCGCSASTAPTDETADTTRPPEENAMTEQPTQTFQVTGMTCGHCASAVTEEIKQLPGVSDVAVDLVAGGTSSVRVTGTEALDDAVVATALEEAGDYQLARGKVSTSH